MSKCPVCDWDIKDGGVTVKAGGKAQVVCCDECAEKLVAADQGRKPGRAGS